MISEHISVEKAGNRAQDDGGAVHEEMAASASPTFSATRQRRKIPIKSISKS